MGQITAVHRSGESAIAKLESTPVLLVHGDADTGVSLYHSERLHLKSVGLTEIWRYEGYGHLKIFEEESNRERLIAHIRQYLPKIDEGVVVNRKSEKTDERELE